jgi:hypothetical protein
MAQQLVPSNLALLFTQAETQIDQMNLSFHQLMKEKYEPAADALHTIQSQIKKFHKEQMENRGDLARIEKVSFYTEIPQLGLPLSKACACFYHGATLAKQGDERGKRLVKIGCLLFANTLFLYGRTKILAASFFKTSLLTRLLRVSLHGISSWSAQHWQEKIVSELTEEEKSHFFTRYHPSIYYVQMILHVVQLFTKIRETHLNEHSVQLNRTLPNLEKQLTDCEQDVKMYENEIYARQHKLITIIKNLKNVMAQIPIPAHLLTPSQ